MALPASGPISMSMIRTELDNGGVTSNLSLTLLGSMSGSGATRTSGYVALNQSSTNKPSPSFPASIGEWYSYSHRGRKECGSSDSFTLGGYYTFALYLITGENGSRSTTTMYLPTSPGGNTIKCYIYNQQSTGRISDMPFNSTGGLTTVTPNFDGTFTTTTPQTYSHTFTSGANSRSLYIVAWDNSASPGSYDFVVSPSCGTTTTTSTTTTTTTAGSTTTSTTTTTTTAAPTTTTTSTTTTTTTAAPTTTTTSTTTTTTTAAPTTTTTTTSTTTTTTTVVGNAFCVGYSAASDCCISITNYSFECDFCQLCTF